MNGFTPIFFTDFGIFISLSDMHLPKASCPIFSMPSGRVSFSKYAHPQKASASISLTPSQTAYPSLRLFDAMSRWRPFLE